MPDGSEHPVVYASHTLQVDTTTLKWSRKLFSLIFGLCKIHPYLNGRRFTIVMDHKPLITILGWKQGIPTLALGHGNMDGLSRLLLPETSNEATMLNVIAYLLLLWTGGCHLKWFVDELSSEVHETMVATASPEVPFPHWLNELMVKGETIFGVIRVVVQAIVRVRVMDERHQGHPRIVWMKALARNYVRWHKFEEVEKRAKSAPVKAPLHP